MTMEWFDTVDENGTVTGRATRAHCHGGSKPLHPVVHLHVFDSRGRLLLQKRTLTKDIQPGKWDTSVGGHIQAGEALEHALRREVEEEIGIRIDPDLVRPMDRYLFESEVEREYVYSYAYTHDGPFRIQEEEIDEVRFLDAREIDSLIAAGETTPNFIRESLLLKAKGLLPHGDDPVTHARPRWTPCLALPDEPKLPGDMIPLTPPHRESQQYRPVCC